MPTLGEVIAELQLTAAAVPPLLIRAWTQDVFAQLCSGSRWGWQRRTTSIVVPASRSLAAVTLTNNSTTITAAALFVAADAGRQIWVAANLPILTIQSVTDANTAVLAEVFPGATQTTAVTVYTAFYQPPAGFQQFLSLSDLTNQRPLPFWLTLERIDLWDPSRVQTGTPRALVAHTEQVPHGTTDPARVAYEWWPRATAGGTYKALYLAGPQTDTLTEDTELPRILADRAYVLKDGVLARCAAFPGTPDTKNPYFNLALARDLGTAFAVGRKDLSIVEDDQFPRQMVDDIDWNYVERGVLGGDLGYQWSDAAAVGNIASSWYN